MMQDGVYFLILINIISGCDKNTGVINEQYGVREFIFGKSLIYVLNSKGIHTEPCEMPCLIVSQPEE
jgi:hypothetical protein